MIGFRLKIAQISFLLLSLLPTLASAQFFLVSEANSFVDEKARQQRFGIEVEFKGLSESQIITLIKHYYPEATATGDIQSGITLQTAMGEIKIIIEGQAYKFENDPVKFKLQQAKDLVEAPREIVFPPVRYDELVKMDNLIHALQSWGAVGTSKNLAVSLQVNLEMPELTNKENVKLVVDLLRNYFNPKHREQVASFIKPTENRSPYILDLSPGFFAHIQDPNYAPTPREFYEDFMYRQSLELLGHSDAWTANIEKVQSDLLNYPGESAVVPRVVKMNKLRISSLLLLAFPNDPLSKRVVESRWARPMPVVEAREFNNDFSLLPKVRWMLGLTRATELFGAYDHDKLFGDLTGMSGDDIQRLRKGILKGKTAVRYVLQSPDDDPLSKEDRDWLKRYNDGIIQIQLSPEKIGTIPLVLGDGSIVWHRRNVHRTTLLGEFNPGLENALMQQALENKLVEAFTFNKYAPNSFPETIALKSIPGAITENVQEMVAALNQRFPTGWVLKGAWDLSSEKIIVTDKTNFTKALADYHNGYQAFKAQVLEESAGKDPEAIIVALKKHPGFVGDKIINMLSDKNLLLVQQRRKLVEEFRVEVLGGRVLGQGSTIPRYAYLTGSLKPIHPVFIPQAERFTQAILDRLPAELKVIPYAFDVALTDNGEWVVIETNPGGNSSFLEENPKSSKALVEYLKNYTPPKEGILSANQQMAWLQNHLHEFSLKGQEMYPGIDLGVDSFEDTSFPRAHQSKDLIGMGKDLWKSRVGPKQIGPNRHRCEAILLQ